MRLNIRATKSLLAAALSALLVLPACVQAQENAPPWLNGVASGPQPRSLSLEPSDEIVYRGRTDFRTKSTTNVQHPPGSGGCVLPEEVPPTADRQQYWQWSWRQCRTYMACTLACPDGQPWGAGRTSIPESPPDG